VLPVTVAVKVSEPLAETVVVGDVTLTDTWAGVDELFDELPPQAMIDKLRRVATKTVIALVRTVVSPSVRLLRTGM
jgi:hypothetical protein